MNCKRIICMFAMLISQFVYPRILSNAPGVSEVNLNGLAYKPLTNGAIYFMLTMKYSEKLKDPRWQKKRLEILNRDEWTCQYCGAKDKTLNVHHYFYPESKNPWDSDEVDLTTLCEDCHQNNHEKNLPLTAHEIYSQLVVFAQLDSPARIVLRQINEMIKTNKNG